eukprot:TCONS_00049508-protein
MENQENIFEYDSNDFIIRLEESAKKQDRHRSKFEEKICSKWEEAMANGAFWYTLDEVKTKEVPGKYKFVAQLNEKRFAQRRKPETATKVSMPFDPQRFNFNKVKSDEILMELKNKNRVDDANDQVIINVSPIMYGHVLLVPNVTACQPQVLDVSGIETAVKVCLLTVNRSFCLGFNSLCALASVNHQHFHASFIQEDLLIDQTKARCLRDDIYVIEDYAVNGFAFQLKDSNTEVFAQLVHSVTTWLTKNNIAHNIFMSRQRDFSYGTEKKDGFYVTLFLFPKKPCPGMKDARSLNSCCYDLAGYLLTKDAEQFDSLTEEKAVEILQRYTLNDQEFTNLCHQMLQEI